VQTQENVHVVEELDCSHGQPETSIGLNSPREIARETGISRSSVLRTVNKDLHLKSFRRLEVQLLSSTTDNEKTNSVLHNCKKSVKESV